MVGTKIETKVRATTVTPIATIGGHVG